MTLEAINARLRAANLGVTIAARGKGSILSLRAKVPPKNGSGSSYWQYISLGLQNNPAGLKRAELEAKKLSVQIGLREFRWDEWIEPETPDSDTVAAWIERYEAEYFNRRSRNPKSETTWRTDYKQPFGQLPQNEPISPEILRQSILETEPDTRNRQRRCMALGQLAKFAGVDLDAKSLRGDYSPKRLNPRDLPSDKEISQSRDRISTQNESWAYAFGLMACYGLRNHELFHIDLERLRDSPVLSLTEDLNGGGKTGSRRVWACYPEWWDKWRLWDVKLLPKVTGKSNSDLGNRVTHAFKRYGFSNPYNLRHCWAVRTIEFDIPVELASQQMGHSLKIHHEIYHHWISDDVHQRAFDRAMRNHDRPLPP
ncbi:integrase family protein [Leptolyngbya sp. NIES-3755]|nr:integrase family protein [Leptolyngbya sp. NIES-3755]